MTATLVQIGAIALLALPCVIIAATIAPNAARILDALSGRTPRK